MFTLNMEEAEQDENVVTGTFSLSCGLVTVLLDTSATHSFISHNCVNRLGLLIEPLLIRLDVVTSLGINSTCTKKI